MTTILCVKKDDKTVIASDGQVTMGHSIVKSNANKLRTIGEGKGEKKVIAGFAGSTADAFTLFERLEEKIKNTPQLAKACTDLAKDWRSDKFLRKLEAMMIVANKREMFVLSGTGDVLSPEHSVIGIGSGGFLAQAAATALMDINGMSAMDITKKAMNIAVDICIYSNNKISINEV